MVAFKSELLDIKRWRPTKNKQWHAPGPRPNLTNPTVVAVGDHVVAINRRAASRLRMVHRTGSQFVHNIVLWAVDPPRRG